MNEDQEDQIIEIRGDFRVALVHDDDSWLPENYLGCPVIQMHYDTGGFPCVDHTGYGVHCDPGFDAERVLRYFLEMDWGIQKAVKVFERYVRIFHDGSVETYSDPRRRELAYVAFTTRSLARQWGVADDEPVSAAETYGWRAYIEGEVYGYVVEERADWFATAPGSGRMVRGETWVEIESLWGLCGEEYALHEAREALGRQVRNAAKAGF